MNWRLASLDDVPLLAEMNAGLIRDERARTRLGPRELEERMRDWLAGEYRAVLFERENQAIAYALYRAEGEGLYLRQFYVRPDQRRRGVGLEALETLRNEVWSPGVRVTLEVFSHNVAGLAFWRAAGFRDYAITFESGGAP